MARKTADLPGTLTDLYNIALGLVSGYGIDLNKLLAEAARRRVANPNTDAPPATTTTPPGQTPPASGTQAPFPGPAGGTPVIQPGTNPPPGGTVIQDPDWTGVVPPATGDPFIDWLLRGGNRAAQPM